MLFGSFEVAFTENCMVGGCRKGMVVELGLGLKEGRWKRAELESEVAIGEEWDGDRKSVV